MALSQKIANYDEFAVGANHPSLPDVQNRAHLIDHDQYGAHVKFGSTQFTNKSGASRVSGDVCILDSGNDAAFKTTTTAADTNPVIVVQESIASNVPGYIALFGYVADLKVTGAVTRLHWLRTSATATRAEDAGASRVKGTFAIALAGFAGPGTGTVPAFLIPPAGNSETLAAGTVMLFKQAAAPTGWTRYVAAGETDSAIIARTNGEAPGTGGTWTISGLSFAGDALATHTHTFSGSALATHQHTESTKTVSSGAGGQKIKDDGGYGAGSSISFTHQTSSGSSAASTEAGDLTEGVSAGTPAGINSATSGGTPSGSVTQGGGWRPKYIEVLIATKD